MNSCASCWEFPRKHVLRQERALQYVTRGKGEARLLRSNHYLGRSAVHHVSLPGVLGYHKLRLRMC